jgi:hypothetical protein
MKTQQRIFRAAAIMVMALSIICVSNSANNIFASVPSSAGMNIPHDWTTNLPSDTDTISYFWGRSGKSRDQQEAAASAQADASASISRYVYTIVQGETTDTLRIRSEGGRVVEDIEIINSLSADFTKSIIAGIRPIRSHPTRHSDGTVELQILVAVSKADIAKARADIDSHMLSLSRHYTAQIKNQGVENLTSLRQYRDLIVLRLNPLERSLVRFLDTPERISLYLWLNEQIAILGGDLHFAYVEFRGNFSGFEHQIRSALQARLNANDVPLHFADSAGDTSLRIIVTGTARETPSGILHWQAQGGLLFEFVQGRAVRASVSIRNGGGREIHELINVTLRGLAQESAFFLRIKEILKP